MVRIIDADELKRELAWLYKNAEWGSRETHFSLADMECNIDMMATVYSIRQGRWLERGLYALGYRCSICNEVALCRSRYCPNCGARMDDEDN